MQNLEYLLLKKAFNTQFRIKYIYCEQERLYFSTLASFIVIVLLDVPTALSNNEFTENFMYKVDSIKRSTVRDVGLELF